MLTLLDLPDDVLLRIAEVLRNLEDFVLTASTCRRLRAALALASPKPILRLADRVAPTFFSPHPDFLALATARQLAHWVAGAPASRTPRLVAAFRSGPRGILDLALHSDGADGVGLTLPAIRRLHALRTSLINPLDATIDAMIGKEWYAQENFWNSSDVADQYTLYADVGAATLQALLYGELFAPALDSFLDPADHRLAPFRALDADVRIEFVKYCVPDWICDPMRYPEPREDGFEVAATGPYAPLPLTPKSKGKKATDRDVQGEEWHDVAEQDEEGQEEDEDEDDGVEQPQRYLPGHQTALAHLFGSLMRGKLWKRAWQRVLAEVGALADDGDPAAAGWPSEWRAKLRVIDEQEAPRTGWGDDWRFGLFWRAVTQVGGLEGMAPVAQFKGREDGRDVVVMKPEWRARILRIRDQALALAEANRPAEKSFRKRPITVSQAPDFAAELLVCCSSMWG
ncbi:hypothetical protein DFJ73DRAFT_960142 [Zopfochytrium polystomum]|nr:hypothetical protein DFJ73DRAFT_960142 [Zopfochytrium polystomum]